MSFGCTTNCLKPSGSHCHCTDCHRTYRTVTDFESHRRGSIERRYCEEPAVMGLIEIDNLWASVESHANARATARRLADSRSLHRKQSDEREVA